MTNKISILLGILLLAVATIPADASGADDSADPLAEKIRLAVLSSPWYGVFDIVYFDIDGFDVTLTGFARNPNIKEDIGRRVEKIPVVNEVENRIEVLPVSMMDDAIRRMVYRKLFSTADMYRYTMGPIPSIRIIVNNGHVRLEGMVSNEADRRLALMASRGIPGVFSVTSNLILEN